MKIAKNELTSLHYHVYDYLKQYCIGKDNAIGMNDLAETMFVSDREIRQTIKDLVEKKQGFTMIVSCAKGYYIPLDEQESTQAHNMIKSRLKGALTRYVASNPTDVNWIFTLLNELKQEYDTPPQNQSVIPFNKGQKENVNWYGKEYKSLFEFGSDNK